MLSEVDNCDLDKEIEKKARKRRETSVDRDKYEDDITEIDKRRSSSRSERTKDNKYRDVKREDGSYGDKYREDSYRDDRHKDEKYWDDIDKDSRRTGDKYYEDDRHRSDKYCEDVDIDNRYKDDKFHQGDDRDYGHKDPKYLDETERRSRRRDDKYREDSGRDGRHWDDRYQEEEGKDVRHNDDRYREDRERDDRQRDNTYREDGERDNRRKEEKHREDSELDSRHRGDKQRDEANRHKRSRDESMLRDRPGDRSDAKRLRDESYSTDFISRKSGLGESSPSYDIRISKYKDEQERRRNNNKDYGDIKSQSCKDQRYDAEKISASGSRLDSISNRGKSSSRVTDLELSSNDSKKRSPSSTGHYATRDHYRHLKQDEATNKDYAYQEKGNNYLGDGFTGGYLKSDSHILQPIDKSPSLTSNGRRHVNRSEVRQCLDAEDPTQRSVDSRDLKDFSGKERKGSRELPLEAPVGDELSQADGVTLSVSSPFIRGGNFSSATKSSLPPPVLRSGVDSPFGCSEDDSRGKPSNRHRRTSDPNIGRFQGNSWKGVTNWPSPVANGYMPFQHGPPPVGFPPMMQQFPAPPMFGIRTPLEMSHPGLPYHLPNADRYPGHGHPIGWRIPMSDSCGPSLHAWDSTNPVFGDEAQFYGRPDWDQYTTMSRSRSWETNEMWKGPNGSASVEPPSASQKEDNSAQGLGDDTLTGQSALQVQSEQRQPDLEVESKAISQSSEAVEKNTSEGSKTSEKEASSQSKLSRRDGPHYCHVYLSKLDISADLTEPELYNQCTGLLLANQNMITDDASKILFVEAVGARLSRPSEISSASLFAAMRDSIFQKSISLYKKERQEIKVTSGEKVLCSNLQIESFPASEQEKSGSEDSIDMELNQDSNALGTGDTHTRNHQIEDLMVVDIVKKPEQAIYVVGTEGMDVDVGSNLTHENDTAENVEGSVEPISDPSKNLTRVSNDLDHPSPNRKEGNKLFDGPLVCPEVVVPLSIESGSVNLSRIHHSPEIKH
ncbi:PREDICTED: uncharacterized protein LOC109148140 isoform X2 [Ipomoea nil]|uniref:uncharacterized protein LOC109148140 isoform X2 n=1 Tax=Ipomoea nil TaxID=35883 RepID=UPI000901E61A|nr:PREDICTED: uncharacterized protein LOC109148140 isoform X2 [Ipomoea nil]